MLIDMSEEFLCDKLINIFSANWEFCEKDLFGPDGNFKGKILFIKIFLVSSYKEQTLSFEEFPKNLEIIRRRNKEKKLQEILRAN